MRIPLGAFYVDDVREEASVDRLVLINRDPTPDQDTVPINSHIRLTVAVLDDGDGMVSGSTLVYVRTTGEGEVLAFDGAAFHATYASSVYTERFSFAPPDDEHVLDLVRATPFVSLEYVEVRVIAQSTLGLTLDETYTFRIEDLTAPLVLSAATRGLRTLRVTFNEPISASAATAGGALRIRDISGGLDLDATGLITANTSLFAAGDVGLYLGIYGATNVVNDGIYTITEFVSSQSVRVDEVFLVETLPSSARAFVSPYRVTGVADADGKDPFFEPVVVDAVMDGTSIVELSLHDDLSPVQNYALFTVQVDDLRGNRLTPASSTSFTSEELSAAADRDFSLWDMIPLTNKREDLTHDLERFILSLDDATRFLLSDTDRFNEVVDIDLVPSGLLDALLATLGNPFAFTRKLSALGKRRLAEVLVEIYKRKGIELGIESVVNFLFGVPINVRPLRGWDEAWVLGESELGVDTLLAPGTSFLRFSFEVISPRVLTADERLAIDEVVNFMKPAHTHYFRRVEPGDGVPPAPSDIWILGESFLGESTALGA